MTLSIKRTVHQTKTIESDARLLLFHIDDLYDGAEIGDVIRHLYEWKALHVQVMTTVTRQNRTGHTVLVETEASDEWYLAHGLATEYGIARYHRLETVLMREDGFVVELAEG